MRFVLPFLFFLFSFLPACGESNLPAPSTDESVDESVDSTIASLVFSGPGGDVSLLTLQTGQSVPLTLRVLFADGQMALAEPVVWFSNNSSVVAVSTEGVVSAMAAGRTNILASVLNVGASLEVLVSDPQPPKPRPQFHRVSFFPPDFNLKSRIQGYEQVPVQPVQIEADPVCACSPFDSNCSCDPMEHFLGPEDDLQIAYGENAGFGSHLFPEILYGFPYAGGQHVVSFGGGGVFTVTLHGRVLVDGPGPDFTVFENPIDSAQYGDFAERARVLVSTTGNEGDYVAFSCNAFDPHYLYEGCAGVVPVNISADPRDPAISGGDSFDLADLGIPAVRSIRIVDLNTCQSDDPSFNTRQAGARCNQIGTQGFDLDAIAIVNKHNE